MSWGNAQTFPEKAMKTLLSPASLCYAAASGLRERAYAANALKSTKLNVPVISVGNITCGGTGKTPVTIELARLLTASGRKVGILSRGYKRKSTEPTVIVNDGKGRFASVEDSGDEPLVIAHNVPEAVVLVGQNRSATGALATSQIFACDIIVLDDGMQHLKLQRDCNLILIDYNDELENDAVLPAGRLREPLTALARASEILITKVPQKFDQEKIARIRATITKYASGVPVSLTRTTAAQLITESGNTRPLADLLNARIAIFSGLANPEGFRATMLQAGANIIKEFRFKDHHWYSPDDLHTIELAARDVDFIVTTEKDLVKLPPDNPIADKLYAVQIKVEWIDYPPRLLNRYAHKQLGATHT